MSTALPYMLAFCRIAVGLVFAVSFGGKVLDIPAFEQTIARFRLLPHRASRLAALMFLGSEMVVVALMSAGGHLLGLGFGLATLLLLTFCVALISALVRHVDTSCNCFGTSERAVSTLDIWRNVALSACTLGGCGLLAASDGEQGILGAANWVLVGLAAAMFVAAWTHLGEIARLFWQG